MKNILTFLALLISLVCAKAQDLTMITSKEALRTYAIEQTKWVSGSVGTALPTGTESYNFVPVESSSVDGILSTIRHLDLSVNVANPNDTLYSWTSVMNSDSDTLFWGYKDFRLQLINGQYLLPTNFGNIELTMVSEVPIKIDGAVNAQINLLDANGKTTASYSLRVYNGKVYFPSALAGDKAILSVSTRTTVNGPTKWNYWTVTTGSKITPTNLGVPLQAKVDGIFSLTDVEVDAAIYTVNGRGENVTVEYHATNTQTLKVSFYTSENKIAKSILIRKAGTTTWLRYPIVVSYPNSPKATIPNVAAGIYYIIPEWNEGDLIQPEETWYPPYYGTTTTTTTQG